MESQAIELSVERSADLSEFDEMLSTILKDFFQAKQIPIDGQQLLLHELRRSFVYSAAEFNAYLCGDPANVKVRFGRIWVYFGEHPQGNASLDRRARDEQLERCFEELVRCLQELVRCFEGRGPSKYESEESEYGERPQKPRPSKNESEESEYGERPQKPHGSRYEDEDEDGGRRRPQRPQADDEEYGGGYGRRPQKSQYDEEEAKPYEGRQESEEGPYGSGGHGRVSKPRDDGEAETEKPKKSRYD